jgi:hypothetical protein
VYGLLPSIADSTGPDNPPPADPASATAFVDELHQRLAVGGLRVFTRNDGTKTVSYVVRRR